MPSPPLTPLAAAALKVEPAPERLLEVECGEGDGALFLAREFPAARVRLDPEGRVAFKQGSPGSLPFPDDFFDLVALVDGRPEVGELARVLRPGGQLILARSRRPGALGRLGQRLLHRQLAAAGIALERSAEAGDGSFSVGRLAGTDPRTAGV